MASVNKVILIGNLGSDPEVRYTASGTAVSNFNIATNEQWNNKEGQKEERTEWHRIVTWGRTAELCSQYLTKGRPVYLEGRLQTREWEDKEGHKRTTTEIVATTVKFLGSRADAGSYQAPAQPAAQAPAQAMAAGSDAAEPAMADDDIPF